ncbi:MAG: PEP-CTERM sorting domain-containing protein [Akkermansia muciniphila]|nr:PEP-CTERM sorting domain-containing protein [Akkermansia muciniphila]
MRKTIITFLALAGAAIAAPEVLLDSNFVQDTTADFIPGSNGWNNYGFNKTYQTTDSNRRDKLDVGAKGLVAAGKWNNNTIEHSITLDSSALTGGMYYQITYSTSATGSQNAFVCYLSSDSYSLTLGNSYDTNKSIVLGKVDSELKGNCPTYQQGAANGAGSYEGGVGIVPTSLTTVTNGSVVSPYQAATYTLNISAGLITGVVAIGESEYSFSSEINNSFNFDTIGFVIDGEAGAVGLKSVKVTLVPEPTTATLSLFALAGLAARRRRK